LALHKGMLKAATIVVYIYRSRDRGRLRPHRCSSYSLPARRAPRPLPVVLLTPSCASSSPIPRRPTSSASLHRSPVAEAAPPPPRRPADRPAAAPTSSMVAADASPPNTSSRSARQRRSHHCTPPLAPPWLHHHLSPPPPPGLSPARAAQIQGRKSISRRSVARGGRRRC
jgi:hypothetical protein